MEVLDVIRTMTGAAVRISFAEGRVGDQDWYVSDTSKFTRATGWQPLVSVPDSIKHIYDWLQSGSAQVLLNEERVA
jgi:CDP-paratose 2-epimerase